MPRVRARSRLIWPRGRMILFSKGSDPLALTNTAEPTTITGPGASVLTVSANKTVGGGRVPNRRQCEGVDFRADDHRRFYVLCRCRRPRLADLTSCTVSDNIGVGYAGLDGKGTPAGGLYIKGSATVSDCTFSDNNGNGLYNAGTALISDCTITGNYAIGQGGGVGSDGNTTLTDCTITGNFAGFGAGVYDKGTLTVTGCTINNNGTSSKPVPASIAGSGVFEKGTGKLYDSTISGNYAGTGTGVYNDGSLTVANCTISGNSADGSGGGVWNEAGTASFTDCTITGNTTPFYGGDLGNRCGAQLSI